MKAFSVALLLPLLVMFCDAVLAEVNVPLMVEEHNGIARSGEVVSAGVPFAVGGLQDADLASLRVEDSGGSAVPAQFQVLSRWWSPRYDNSIRWLLVTFPASAGANATASYTLKSGTNVPPVKPVSVTTDAGLTIVDTGNIKAAISDAPFRLFEAVWLDANADGQYDASEKVVQAAADDGLVITSGDWSSLGINAGDQFRASAGTATVEVEESGPVRAVVHVSGTFQRENAPAITPYYEYGVRLYFHAGSPLVRCHVTLRNNRIMGQKVYAWPIEDFAVRTSLASAGAGQYAILGQTAPVRGTLAGNTVKLYQDSNGTDNWLTLTGNSVEQWLCPWTSGTAVRGVTFRGYKIYDGATEVETSNYARGWADLTDGTLGVAAGVKDFWQQYPKVLRVSAGRIDVGLLPADWSEVFSLKEGSRKRHEILYNFHAGSLTDQQMTDLYLKTARPLYVRCPPGVYIASGAWDGGVGNQGPTGYPSSYDKYAASGTSIGVQYGWDWYGEYYTWNAGGSHANEGSMLMPWILWGEWRKFEQVENNLLWDDLAAAVMFDQPIDMAQHWHYLYAWPNIGSTGVTEQRFPAWYDRAKWGRPDTGHCAMWHHLEYYYLTGDRHALEQVCYYGQYATWNYYPHFHLGTHYIYSSYYGDPDDPNYMYGNRYWGWPLWNLAQAYEATGDASYLADASLAFKGVRNALRQSPLKFAHETIYNAGSNIDYYSYWPVAVRATAASQGYAIFQMSITARAAAKYYQETADDDALDIMVAHGDFLVDTAANRDAGGNIFGWPYCWGDYWGPNDTAGGGAPATSIHPDLASALGWAFELARKPAFTRDLQAIYTANKLNKDSWIYAGYMLKAALSPPADLTPPAPITDLHGRVRADGTLLVAWTAPGNDGATGRAANYQLKYATAPLVEKVTGWPDMTSPLPMTVAEWRTRAAALKATQLPFVSAWNVSGEPTPAAAGTVQSMTVPGLAAGIRYYLAFKSLDAANNLADLGNVFGITTSPSTPGDLNGDAHVDAADLLIFVSGWGTRSGDPRYDPVSDLNDNGAIDVSDLLALANHWGQ
jgi:hypothetical protein